MIDDRWYWSQWCWCGGISVTPTQERDSMEACFPKCDLHDQLLRDCYCERFAWAWPAPKPALLQVDPRLLLQLKVQNLIIEGIIFHVENLLLLHLLDHRHLQYYQFLWWPLLLVRAHPEPCSILLGPWACPSWPRDPFDMFLVLWQGLALQHVDRDPRVENRVVAEVVYLNLGHATFSKTEANWYFHFPPVLPCEASKAENTAHMLSLGRGTGFFFLLADVESKATSAARTGRAAFCRPRGVRPWQVNHEATRAPKPAADDDHGSWQWSWWYQWRR